MADVPNSPVVLRAIKPLSAEKPAAPPQTGIAFECPTQTKCPHCKAVVPLADTKPLSEIPCPTCGGAVFVPARVANFLLYAHIGEGEMGAIYRATDESLFRDVAIKLVRGCLADDRESRERLRREACAAGKVNHPRVAQVHALNFSNGHPYLVMELVSGEDFSQMLEREGRIDERTVLKMALDVADGLSALNREGLVHGDIKPGNIVLDRDGNAKLVDFGLSGMTRRDSSGNFVGTPDYLAPELIRGATDSHSSDLYSFGATLYHLLSGKPPFEGETAEDVLKVRLSTPPVPLGKVDRHISVPTQKLVMRMLELHPARRPANSDVVAADIRDALSRLDLTPSPVSPSPSPFERFHIPRLALSERQRRALVTGVLCLVAGVNLLVAVEQDSFRQTFSWLRRGYAQLKDKQAQFSARRKQEAQAAASQASGPAAKRAPNASPPPSEPGSSAAPRAKTHSFVKVVVPAVKATKPSYAPAAAARKAPPPKAASSSWQSVNLGSEKVFGSTMQMGDTLIVQGTGTDMWMGADSCRFVWTKAASNYTFSAQLQSTAANNSLAVSGMLVKGDDPSAGPGLLFGRLGSGELFLQTRQPDARNTLAKRSDAAVALPRFLRLERKGDTFKASVSPDGRAWEPFASCELSLPPVNAVGFCVSSQDTNALAAAKFSNIFLLEPDLPGGPQTNKLSAGGRPSAPPGRRW